MTHSLPALSLSIFVVAASAAYGQSAAEVSRVREATATYENRFTGATANLHEMSQTLTGSEFDAAHQIVLLSNEFYAYFESVGLLELVLTRAKCADDLRLHQIAFGTAASSLVSVANKRLPAINQLLAFISKPAALAEATRLRDLVVETRDIYKPFTDKD